MSDKTVDTQAALTFGWNTLRDNFVFFLKLLGVLIGLAVIPAMVLGKIAASTNAYLGIPLQFINIVWQSVLGMGLLKICLNLYDKRRYRFQIYGPACRWRSITSWRNSSIP